MRGGVENNERAELDDETEEVAADTSPTNPNRESKTSWLSPLESLLDLNHSVKIEASQESLDEEKQEIGRGGALVKIKPPAPTRSWWLVSSFVSPFVRNRPSTVDNEEDNVFSESDAEYDPNKTSRFTTAKSRIASSVMASAKSVKRVWWVNSWADQLPSDQEAETLLLESEEERNRTDIIADMVDFSNSDDAEKWDSATDEVQEKDGLLGNRTEQALATPSLDSTIVNDTVATVQAIDLMSRDETPPDAIAYNSKKKKKVSLEKDKTDDDYGDGVTEAETVGNNLPMSSNASKAVNPYVSSGYVRYYLQIFFNYYDTVFSRTVPLHFPCSGAQ
jgi:hypothetical protein